MTCADVISTLTKLGTSKVREHNIKFGVSGEQLGVKMGDIRAMANQIKANPELAQELWGTGIYDARILACLIMKPKQLSLEQLTAMTEQVDSAPLMDTFGTNVIKMHPQKESLREVWMGSSQPLLQRMGWSLTAERIIKSPDGLDLSALLDRLDREMPGADSVAQWTMNYCLAEIGIRFAEYRPRALAMGERIGAFRDYPTSKGCTSPYAPIWIAEMVRRAESAS